ncbi:hypothetical protein [Nitrolancea hollandica]|uniref:Uncharacterized protein n=1 Tax=Nitrolancea hollandica Lb TaxID=1129897 RepID=I4EL27_9BACT|nr:hypothetical protein [Nitrolancea hollandica]CCF85389.1 hypothetical protein NITHO_4910004 [Nitrolancea hollandica Lb]
MDNVKRPENPQEMSDFVHTLDPYIETADQQSQILFDPEAMRLFYGFLSSQAAKSHTSLTHTEQFKLHMKLFAVFMQNQAMLTAMFYTAFILGYAKALRDREMPEPVGIAADGMPRALEKFLNGLSD